MFVTSSRILSCLERSPRDERNCGARPFDCNGDAKSGAGLLYRQGLIPRKVLRDDYERVWEKDFMTEGCYLQYPEPGPMGDDKNKIAEILRCDGWGDGVEIKN